MLFKIKINNNLNDGKVILINNIETRLMKLHLISVNFDDYIKKRMNIKNIIYSKINYFIYLFGIIRLTIGAFATDPYIWTLIAEPFYLIGDRALINLILLVYAAAGLKIQFLYIICKFILK